MVEEDSLVFVEGGELEGGEGDLLLFWRCLPCLLLPSFKKELGLWLGQRLLFDAWLGERGMRLLWGATLDKCSSLSVSLGLLPPLREGSTTWFGASTWLLGGMRFFERINACTMCCNEGLVWASCNDCTKYLKAWVLPLRLHLSSNLWCVHQWVPTYYQTRFWASYSVRKTKSLW